MQQLEFKDLFEGLRVVVNGCLDGGRPFDNASGTVVVVSTEEDLYPFGIEFDMPIRSGHDCNGRGKSGHCRFGRMGDIANLTPLVLDDLEVSEAEVLAFDEFLSGFNVK